MGETEDVYELKTKKNCKFVWFVTMFFFGGGRGANGDSAHFN